MFTRRRLLFTVAAAGACLLLASGAPAAPGDTFTAASTPSSVQPSKPATYTLTLTNTSSRTVPSSQAEEATITAPEGFAFVDDSATASASASGACAASLWEPNINDDRIRLRDSDGEGNTRLCPGATLTVVFAATAPAVEDTFDWEVSLSRGDEEEDAFTRTGPPPTVEVDGTLPTLTIVQKPLDPSGSSSASFAFMVSETAATVCKIDSGEFLPCNSPVGYANLGDGLHTFAVRAADPAGNTGEASHTWTIETRPPTAAVASGPAALANSRSATFTFTADEPSSFACQLDGGSFQPCTSPASYAGLGDGAHTFAVRPTDALGNSGAATSYAWTIDATAPETTLGSAPRSGTTAVAATFTFSASEAASFECKLDDASLAPCTSPRSYAALSRSGHSFEVRAIDTAGNVEPAPAAHRWTIAAAPRRATRTTALLAPQAGARVTSPPLLVWRRAARASYYNVQLYRGSVKVLSSWPTRTRLQLRSRWTYLRRTRKLAAGVYRWYVWPGYGRPAANRYGRLLGQSTFTVVRR
jgi:hypothetical protein